MKSLLNVVLIGLSLSTAFFLIIIILVGGHGQVSFGNIQFDLMSIFIFSLVFFSYLLITKKNDLMLVFFNVINIIGGVIFSVKAFNQSGSITDSSKSLFFFIIFIVLLLIRLIVDNNLVKKQNKY